MRGRIASPGLRSAGRRWLIRPSRAIGEAGLNAAGYNAMVFPGNRRSQTGATFDCGIAALQ
jgi:hypothetical protein